MAEFDDANALVEAAKRTYAEGYGKMDAYSPFPIEPVWEAMDVHDRPVSFFVLCGGIVGMFAGFGLCYWVSTIAYPLNIGGRPFNSWPSFIPVTFELTILLASFAAVISMLALNGLPMPYHPVFNVPSFARASQDKFFLAIEAVDPKFDRARTFEFMKTLGAREINEVETSDAIANRSAPAARARREVAERERAGVGPREHQEMRTRCRYSSCRIFSSRRRLWVPSGHARSAEVPAAPGERVLREHVERAAARRRHDRARDAADRHRVLHRERTAPCS